MKSVAILATLVKFKPILDRFKLGELDNATFSALMELFKIDELHPAAAALKAELADVRNHERKLGEFLTDPLVLIKHGPALMSARPAQGPALDERGVRLVAIDELTLCPQCAILHPISTNV